MGRGSRAPASASERGEKSDTARAAIKVLNNLILDPVLVIEHDYDLKTISKLGVAPNRFGEIAIGNLQLDGGSTLFLHRMASLHTRQQCRGECVRNFHRRRKT